MRHVASCLLLAFDGLATCPVALAACALTSEAPDTLERWKASGFSMPDADRRPARALQLADCLGDPDPRLRDGIAYDALAAWMRGRQLQAEDLRALQSRLFDALQGDDRAGFRKPFAALVLSEVARTDRVQPWMTTGERTRMVASAASYLRGVRDYRGYVDGEGWRHGVAHGSDWVLQLVLNKALTPAEVMTLLDALGEQVAPVSGHGYVFGEPTRLARPVGYAVARGDLPQAQVDAWLAARVATIAAVPADKREADWWRRRSDLEHFLQALAVLAGGEDAPPLRALSTQVAASLHTLP